MCEVLISQWLRCQWVVNPWKHQGCLALHVLRHLITGTLLCTNFMGLHVDDNSDNSNDPNGRYQLVAVYVPHT